MRVFVSGAGGPAGVNTCRALSAAGHEVVASDQNEEHLIWCEPYADTDWRHAEPCDVLMPQPDSLVLSTVFEDMALTQAGGDFITKRFLPKPQTVLLCQDKFECGMAWRRAGLREDWIELAPLTDWAPPLWIRARHGAGAKAAICARSRLEAEHWMAFWGTRFPDVQFVSEGFLPGRDYSWCGIFRKGDLLVSFARERLEYLYPHLTPEGLTGTPTRAQIVHSADVDEMAEAAVRAVDERPHGVFCVDLREDADGQPRPTEINAGRFSTTVGLWSTYGFGNSNFVALAAELALGDESRLDSWAELPAGLTLSRHIDCGHVFSMAKVPA